ncbi:ABC transporter permease [Pseudothermotoga thermarum]|uniref:Binding-protein-dependent transport systems inner membrane component n=1 Tax=Pseudothermotoga thermarum DSM 5069 TaxID=688269 RepID=F7YW59_9THEM|nr:ABC transporter permease [Pseudothermotoga thermarum]AEH51831.1 binding-protein-dependent transport systems inner membrane component [Pseudothermotoga thermarum DSM 5069]
MKKLYVAIAILIIHLIVAIFADFIAPFDPREIVDLPYQPPSKEHWLGTDRLGRDIFSQLIHGSRLSILIGISVGALMTFLSTMIGMMAGYYGGIVDRILSTLTDVFLVIPRLPLMIVISAYVRVRGPLVVILVIALTSWGGGARIIRSQVLSLKNRDFVAALKATGESDWRIMFFEMLPNMLSLLAANFFSAVLYGILGEASLSFLGLSDVSKITWGTMLYWAQSANALLNGMWYWVLAPGAAIASLGTAFALLNFYVDEMTNPRLRKS